MSVKLTVSVELDTIECCTCFTTFAMTADLNKHFLGNRRESFFCPRGHAQSYLGETEEQKLRRKLASAEQDADWYKVHMETAERSLRATKGVVTKLRKRAEAGACPFGCRRHFADVQRHVASKHPGEALEGES